MAAEARALKEACRARERMYDGEQRHNTAPVGAEQAEHNAAEEANRG